MDLFFADTTTPASLETSFIANDVSVVNIFVCPFKVIESLF